LRSEERNLLFTFTGHILRRVANEEGQVAPNSKKLHQNFSVNQAFDA